MTSILGFVALGVAAVFAVAAAYLIALVAVGGLMVGWYKLRGRPDRVELLLATAASEEPEPPQPSFGYVCDKYDPGFAPTGAPPVAFRKTGDAK